MDENSDNNVTPGAPEGLDTTPEIGVEPDKVAESAPPVSPTPTSSPNPFATFSSQPGDDEAPANLGETAAGSTSDSPADLSEELSTEPAAASTTTPDVFAKPPKKKGLLMALIIGLVVLLVAAGVAAYFIFFQPKTDNTDTKKTDTASTTETITPEPSPSEAADPAKAWADKLKSVVTSQFASANPTMKITDVTTAPSYKAPSANYYVGMGRTDFGKGISISLSDGTSSTTQAQEATYKEIAKAVTDSLSSDTSFTISESDYQTGYQNDVVICTSDSGTSYPLYIYCANTANYSDLISQVAPFAKAYYASDNGKTEVGNATFGVPTISNGSDGYKSAQVQMGSALSPVGGAMGLFYYAGGAWSYFTSTQEMLMCSQFNTHDIQKAFEGYPCYDGETEGEVTVTL